MAIDSTANLLFTIGADASDAQANVQRFRALLSKDLGQMKAEFSDWSARVFGDLSSLKGAMTTGLATLAAGALAAGTALVQAAKHAAAYAEEIDDVNDATGISVEQVSKLRYSMETAGLEFNQGKQGLILFAGAIEAARKGTGEQFEAFRRMRISQREIEAGSRDMLPLLYRVADAFHANANAVEKTATARALMGRGGADWVEFLSRGSAALKQTSQDAERLGKVLTEQDIEAAKEFKLSLVELEAQMKGLALSVGMAALPALSEFAALLMATVETMKKDKGGLFSEFTAWMGFFEEWTKASDRIRKNVEAAMASTGKASFVPPEIKQIAAETKQEFYGLSSIVETLRGRMAGLEGDEAKVYQQAQHFRVELQKAEDELFKLAAAGKISPATFERESAAMKDLPKMILGFSEAEIQRVVEKRNEAILAAGDDLRQRLAAQQEQTADQQRTAWEQELTALAHKLQKERAFTTENQALLDALRQAGYNKIQAEHNEAFARELQTLQQHLAQILTARMTTRERLEFQYSQDAERFGAIEESKALSVAKSEQEQDIIRAQFALNRRASLEAYLGDLNALRNSEGWQGVFGEQFGSAIRGNEELLRMWGESANQSLMMVSVAMEGTQETFQRGFRSFAQGMGQNIAQAFVYRKSIGEAMRAAAASTIAAIASESIVNAIYATGLGFLRLAQHDYAGAAEAFKAAAVFGSVGVIAAVAGRAIAPASSSSSGSSAGSSGSSSSASASGSSAETSTSSSPRVAIYIQGNVVGRTGIDELIDIVNEAVQERDVRLYATAVKQEARLLR